MKNKKASWIVLCATQRSGSTMVCDDLNRHGLGYPEERYLGIVRGMKNNNFDRLKQRLNRISNECLNKETNVASVKIMANYADDLNRAFDMYYEREEPSEDWSSLATFFKNATFVMLHRGNVLEQALSRNVSRKTGVNHLVESKDGNFVPGNSSDKLAAQYSDRAKITMADLRKETRDIVIENHMWSMFFVRNRITPHYLHYEQCAQSTEYLLPIVNSIGYDLPEGVRERNVKKLPKGKTQPLAARFVRTRYPDFFRKAAQS